MLLPRSSHLVSPCLGSTSGFLDPSWGSRLLVPFADLPTLPLDQDKLELELVLKGSYEDTQTSVLGTASAFCFHYMAAQEAELSGCLRVGQLPQISAWPSLSQGQAPVALSASPN